MGRRLPQDLEAHFSNECSEIPANTRQFFLNCLAAKAEGNITINLEQITAKKRKLNNNTGIQTKISDFHESITFTELKIHEIDRACVKAFAVSSIAWHIIENPLFIKFLKTLRPGYTPPSKEYFPLVMDGELGIRIFLMCVV
ncbi:16705_t:CDS:2 [Rhizophagus irregularis]|nr:16705_t:CDS:2 [Rhizophagus irregularis]